MPFCLREQKHLCNFGRGHYERHFCEIILNLDRWFRRKCRLKLFLIYSSGGPFIWQSGTIYAILEEIIMRNISVKLFNLEVQEMLFKSISYLQLWWRFFH